MKVLKRVLSFVVVFALVVSSATVTEAKSKFAPKTGKVTKAVKKIVPPKDVTTPSHSGIEYWITPTKDCVAEVKVTDVKEYNGGWYHYAIRSFTEAYFWHGRNNVCVDLLLRVTEGSAIRKLRLKKGITYYIMLYEGVVLETDKNCLKYEYRYYTEEQLDEYEKAYEKIEAATNKKYKKLIKPFNKCKKCIDPKYGSEWGMATDSAYVLAEVSTVLSFCEKDEDLLDFIKLGDCCTKEAYDTIYTKEYEQALQELYNNYLQFHKSYCAKK